MPFYVLFRHHAGSASFENLTPIPLVTRFPMPSKSSSPSVAEVSIACIFGNLSSDAIRIGLSEMVNLLKLENLYL